MGGDNESLQTLCTDHNHFCHDEISYINGNYTLNVTIKDLKELNHSD